MQDQLRELIHQVGLDSVADKLVSLSKPSIRITRQRINQADLPIGASRLGGMPDLPPDIQWPELEGRPLALVAQFNLTDVAPYDVEKILPSEGWLYFFYDAATQPWGFDPKHRGKWKVIYYQGKNDTLSRQKAPEGLAFPLFARSVNFRNKLLIPMSFDHDFGFELSDEERKSYYLLLDKLIKQQDHWLLGYPKVLQNSMERECQFASNGIYMGGSTIPEPEKASQLEAGVKDWRLLLQIDSDEEEMWCDSGTIYYWIQQDALAQHNFDNVWFVLQCY